MFRASLQALYSCVENIIDSHCCCFDTVHNRECIRVVGRKQSVSLLCYIFFSRFVCGVESVIVCVLLYLFLVSTMDKLKFLVPNSCTAFSLVLGLASVVNSIHGNFELAAWMVLWGVLLDKLDGTFARLLNASSEFGAQLDSFADFVSFGIAPAALFYFGLADNEMVHAGWLQAGCMVFVVATAARLARFNVSEPPLGQLMFYGIPTTFMGAIFASGFLTAKQFQWSDESMALVPFLLFLAAVAMVSSVKLPKIKPRKGMALNIFQAANVLTAYIIAPLQMFPQILFIQGIFYVTVGVIWYALKPPTEADLVSPASQPVVH